MSPAVKRPWYMFYPLAGMLLLCILWSGYWFVKSGIVHTIVAQQRANLAAQGLELTCANESWGGFPFRFEFQCEVPNFHYGGMSLASSKLLAIAQAYNPSHVLLLVNGPTSLSTPLQNFAATHDDALISIEGHDNGDWDVSSDAALLDVPKLFSSAQVRLFARQVDGKTELAGNLTGVVLKGQINLETAEFRTQLIDTQTLDIKELKLTSGPVNFAATGTLGLDARHQRAGKLSTQTNDSDALIELISPLFQISEKDGVTIKSLIKAQNPDPSAPLQKANFTAHHGGI